MLLAVYAVSFGHNLVPHCHSDDVIVENGFDSEHLNCHQHASPENQDEDDVLHQDHLDDSLFDYLLCILSELEVDDTGLIHQTHAEIPTKSISFTSPSLVFPTANNLSFGEVVGKKIFGNYYLVNFLKTPFFESTPHRGPPSLG